MTPEQCIQRLARRLGYFVDKGGDNSFRIARKAGTATIYQIWRDTAQDAWDDAVDINSIDALRPVLATMTPKEKWELHKTLLCQWHRLPISSRPPDYTTWLLTLDPQQLAFAIAEAIGEEREVGGVKCTT